MSTNSPYIESLKSFILELDSSLIGSLAFDELFPFFSRYMQALLDNRLDEAKAALFTSLSIVKDHASSGNRSERLIEVFQTLLDDLDYAKEKEASSKLARCSFCNTPIIMIKGAGVAGPGVFICKSCIGGFEDKELLELASDSLVQCSFCCRKSPEIQRVVVGRQAIICSDCLELSRAQMQTFG